MAINQVLYVESVLEFYESDSKRDYSTIEADAIQSIYSLFKTVSVKTDISRRVFKA